MPRTAKEGSGMAIDKPAAGGAAPLPKSVCPACKTPNDLGSLTCKKCGEIIKKSGKGGKPAQEYDATEGSFSPACVVIPAILILGAVIFFLLAVGRGPKPGTCEYNQAQLGKALWRYNKAHPDSRMTTLNQDELIRPSRGGKPQLKERLTCPVDPTARYEIDTDGVTVICTRCSKKR